MRAALACFGNEESYGLLFVGGELLARGQQIRFFDAEDPGALDALVDWSPDLICLSPLTTFFEVARTFAASARERLPGVVTAFGGHHAFSCPEILDDPAVDVVVVGPARGAVDRIVAGERGRLDVPLTTPADLAPPARREYYRDVPRMGQRYRKFMLAMPGCPWNCTYCSSSMAHLREVFGVQAHRRYFLARRPIEDVIDEARVVLEFPTREIEWVDDDVLAGEDAATWIPAFVEAWEAEIGLPMYVSTTSRYVMRASDETLAALARVARVVGMGIQAARQSSLELFGRGWDSEPLMKDAHDRLRSFGMKVNLQAIVGLPVDDPVEDALETLALLHRVGPGSVCSIYPLQVYPGTAMERLCAERGFALDPGCLGDTNNALPHIAFPPDVRRRLRNVIKLGTMLVRFGVDERWTRALLDVELDDDASRALSMVRYHDCVVDRLDDEGERIFEEILATMKLRY